MVYLSDSRSNVLSRVFVPVGIMAPGARDKLSVMIQQAVSSHKDIVFSVLFHKERTVSKQDENLERKQSNVSFNDDDEFADALDNGDYEGKASDFEESIEDSKESSSSSSSRPMINLNLLTVCNHNQKLRISPLDIQLIYALIKASDAQLDSSESLWLPLCLTRVDPNRFLYAHISYLNDTDHCLALLTLDHGDFQRCQQVFHLKHYVCSTTCSIFLKAKDVIQSALKRPEFMDLPFVRSCISELNQSHLHYICHQTPRHCIMWQSSDQTPFSPLNYYLIDRMQRSSFKTMWLRHTGGSGTAPCSLLGWHTNTFQLYAQFDVAVSQHKALETVQSFIKWFKKEEDKLTIKDS